MAPVPAAESFPIAMYGELRSFGQKIGPVVSMKDAPRTIDRRRWIVDQLRDPIIGISEPVAHAFEVAFAVRADARPDGVRLSLS